MLTLKQFTGSLVTPTDDALFYDFLLSGQCGIFEGCEVTHLGANQLRVSSGRGVILGRIFTAEEETIQAAVSPGGEVDGRLLIRVDMGNEEKPIEFVTQAETPLPGLTQEDINRDGSVYELPLAVYKVTELLISGLERVAEPVQTPIDDSVRQAVQELQAGKFNAAAQRSGTTVAITGPAEAQTITFPAPADWTAGDSYTYNGQPLTLTDLNREPVEDAWKQGAPVTLTLNGNKAFFKAGGGGKLPSDLAPLCPGFKVERNGTKVKISADKIQLNGYTNMVSGGVWAWGKTRPTKPTGENTKLWSRAELITTGKPYDGLYLGDVTASDAVNETILWLPENDSGSVKLVPFIVLSTDYLGGVYMMREPLSESMKATWGGSYYYPGNPVDSFLSATYLNSILDKSISDALLTCSVPVQTKFNTAAVETMDRKCWVPSYGELYDAAFNDGTKMPYFNSTNRIAYINGGIVKGAYWTRTRAKGGSPYSVDTSGGMSNASGWSDTIYIRPSFVLPKDFKIQQRPDGSYTVWNEQGLMTLGDVEPSTGSQKVAFNIPETIKTGLKTKYAEFVYGMKEYNGYSGGLLTRNDNGFASGKMYGALWTQTDAYNVLTQYATYEPSSLTLADRCLHSSIRKILMSVSVKSTDNGGAIHDNEVKCLLLSTREVNDGTYETGTPIPYYSVQANRIMKDASGVVTEAWLRDAPSSPSYQFRFIGQDGQIGTKVGGSTLEIVPSICIPLDTPIRALADGTYDLVPDDPAIGAQTVSTLAEEEVPLEIELDWPESDPLIARQWVYNEKGVYQTMLLGGIASTEDAPAYSPVLSENTWEQIAQACADHDPILDSWLVGDEKDEVINGETLTFAIVGKDHDDKSDGTGKAKLTFGMTQLMSNTRQMNGSNTNAGSFAGSALYAHLRDTILPGMPEELRAAIKPVNKPTSSGSQNSTIRNDSMSLWLFSEVEIFGGTTYSFGGEGFQYPYFATAANRVKRLFNGMGEVSLWWERSPYSYAGPGFCCVTTSGAAHYHYASTSYGVCFGFCIG